MLAQWQNTILPAAQNWETQKDQYLSNYQTWQTQAQVQQQNARATTQQNIDQIVASRNRYVSTTAQAYRKGQVAWASMRSNAEAARNSAANIQITSTDIIARMNDIGGAPGVGNNLSEVLRNLGTLPAPSSEFLNRSRAELPELSNLAIFQSGLSQSLISV